MQRDPRTRDRLRWGEAPLEVLTKAGLAALPILQPSVRRLAGASAAVALGAGLLLTAALVAMPPEQGGHGHGMHFAGALAVLLALSVLMTLLARSRRLGATTVVSIGLLYEVGGALTISFCAFLDDLLLQEVMVSLSWLAVWIVIFPLLVPRSPRVSALASFACALTAPGVFLVCAIRASRPLPELQVLTATFLPYLVCAGLAVLPAVIYRDVRATAEAAARDVRHLGSWQLLERLGRGGMGEVWRATHGLLARPAAIKIVRPEYLRGAEQLATAARFQREALATAQLRSPHTVSVFDYGVAEGGTFYFAMELLDGLDLESLVVEHGPVPPERAIHILQEVCDSLAESHAAGLLHRDIKPGNIILCHLGRREDFTKVVDFGLVTPARSTEADPLLTGDDFVLGTPAYMAPEVAGGAQGDERSDLYSLGCVAYWLLTGRLMVDDATRVEDGRAVPVPPSGHSPHDVPQVLDDLVLACVAADPTSRPSSAGDLAGWLEIAAHACSPWTPARARAWWSAIETTSAAEAHQELQELSWLHRGGGVPGAETSPSEPLASLEPKEEPREGP